MNGRDDRRAQVTDAQAVDWPLDLEPLDRGGVCFVEAGVQFQRRGFDQAEFQQAAGDFKERPLGLVLVDVEDDGVLPENQPVERRFQHGGLADADRAGQQQVPALADLLTRAKMS